MLSTSAAVPAQVVKLVDTLASGASGLTAVEVRVFSWAPIQTKPSHARLCRFCTSYAVIASPQGVAIHGLGAAFTHWIAASLRSSQ